MAMPRPINFGNSGGWNNPSINPMESPPSGFKPTQLPPIFQPPVPSGNEIGGPMGGPGGPMGGPGGGEHPLMGILRALMGGMQGGGGVGGSMGGPGNGTPPPPILGGGRDNFGVGGPVGGPGGPMGGPGGTEHPLMGILRTLMGGFNNGSMGGPSNPQQGF